MSLRDTLATVVTGAALLFGVGGSVLGAIRNHTPPTDEHPVNAPQISEVSDVPEPVGVAEVRAW